MKNTLMGLTATDRITGFKGYIIGVVAYVTGCDQYLLQPKMKKNHSRPLAGLTRIESLSTWLIIFRI